MKQTSEKTRGIQTIDRQVWNAPKLRRIAAAKSTNGKGVYASGEFGSYAGLS